ncbi:unnamed protein product [Cyprideis torosa]|uniref:Uncharacterized protein n=1 Tax=Cyprideis torosa TaxID=163714 RepID=A0A7R8WEL6_9CRUS|nr:unnamed protein product [Cyprideis torosa]CAG0894483.1 unnamed protein product [Cyprideis torosa]
MPLCLLDKTSCPSDVPGCGWAFALGHRLSSSPLFALLLGDRTRGMLFPTSISSCSSPTSRVAPLSAPPRSPLLTQPLGSCVKRGKYLLCLLRFINSSCPGVLRVYRSPSVTLPFPDATPTGPAGVEESHIGGTTGQCDTEAPVSPLPAFSNGPTGTMPSARPCGGSLRGDGDVSIGVKTVLLPLLQPILDVYRTCLSSESQSRLRNLIKMTSESEKESSVLESQSLVEVFHFTKLEDPEVSCVLTEAMPLRDVTPGSMDSNNKTSDVLDQIETSGDNNTVRKGKNSAGHCQQKEQFTCAVCGKSLICGKGFRNKSGLRYHEKKHSEGNMSVCALCGQPFRLVDDLEKHLKRHIQGFRSKSGLRYHEKKHSEENESVCALCGERFVLVDDLEKHLKWHIQGSMENHSEIEAIYHRTSWYILERDPSLAGICGTSFSQSGSLSSHKSTHTGEKPFACRICGKSFSQSGSLSTHKLTHTVEKLFPCRICGKGFRSRSGLRYHEKKHPEESKSVCALCGEPFSLVDELKKHLKWHIQVFFVTQIFLFLKEISHSKLFPLVPQVFDSDEQSPLPTFIDH